MRATFHVFAAVSLAISGCGWAGATVRTSWRAPEAKLLVPMASTERVMRESLRTDVARHPGSFIAFATETAAIRFMNEHALEASRETEHRMLDLGVLGYWQGRMVVVLPIVPTNVP
jgi:hypothetical protein